MLIEPKWEIIICILSIFPYTVGIAQIPPNKEMTKGDYEKLIEQSTNETFKLPKGIVNSNVEIVSDSVQALGIRLTIDSDRDGLIDREEFSIGTSNNNPDTDGDGLLDGWEVHGVNGINLRSLGASPLHKDIFVHMDYMIHPSISTKLDFDEEVVTAIENVFNSSPVQNPDGKPGITIHLERGNIVSYDSLLDPVYDEFLDIKSTYFDPNKAPVYHYMVWVDKYRYHSSPLKFDDTSSGQSMGQPGLASADFIVSLGAWENGQGGFGGTLNQKVGTFIHELGHNLGLRHGCIDDENFKPNHISVMNYFYQMEGVKKGSQRLFTYQPNNVNGIDELALDEKLGLGKDLAWNGYSCAYYTLSRRKLEGLMDDVIDWNGNGLIDNSLVRVDLNRNTFKSKIPATKNEWLLLKFSGDGSPIGAWQPVAGIHERVAEDYSNIIKPELTKAIFDELK